MINIVKNVKVWKWKNEEYVLYLLHLTPKCQNIYNPPSNKQKLFAIDIAELQWKIKQI